MIKQFLILWLLGNISAAALLPYAFDLQREVVANAPVSVWVLAAGAIAQTSIILGFAVFAGLWLCRKIGFVPLAFADAKTRTKDKLAGMLAVALSVGAAAGTMIKMGDLAFTPYLPVFAEVTGQIPLWKPLLASLYGGITEELLLRLFAVSLLLWLFGLFGKHADPARSAPIAWSAIFIAAILFGLGHLPATAQLTELTPLVITRALILNGIGGVAFGWLYLRKGLEAAMIAHFTADIFLLVLLPALLA